MDLPLSEDSATLRSAKLDESIGVLTIVIDWAGDKGRGGVI